MEIIEPKYLTDGTSFYWNPLCPDNHLRFSPDATAEEIKRVRIPVRVFRNGEVLPNNMPEDIAANTRRI